MDASMQKEGGLPAHLAVVMDGNGRWAASRSLPRLQGHQAGMAALKELVKRCSALGIQHLTVYAFSTENWKRPKEEVSGIFKLLVLYVQKEIEELHKNRVRVDLFGQEEDLPAEARRAIDRALERTRDNEGLRFHIALNYGGRAEILRGARALCQAVSQGDLRLEDIDEDSFSQSLYSAGVPDPDLVIRTGGECRLSNFLTWQTAYSELYFSDVLWPDFTPGELDKALAVYSRRQRRYGGLP